MMCFYDLFADIQSQPKWLFSAGTSSFGGCKGVEYLILHVHRDADAGVLYTDQDVVLPLSCGDQYIAVFRTEFNGIDDKVIDNPVYLFFIQLHPYAFVAVKKQVLFFVFCPETEQFDALL